MAKVNVKILDYVAQLLSFLQQFLAGGLDITELIKTAAAAVQAMQNEKRDPTAAEWQQLNALIAALQVELHQDEK